MPHAPANPIRRRTALLAVAILLALGAWSPRASAEPPSQQGWWTVTNVSRVDPPPELGASPLPAAPVPAPPSDVPEGGLLVQGGPQDTSDLPAGLGGPAAFAALVYEVPRGEAAARLVLTLAEGAASTPLAPVRACRLATTVFQPAQGGPMADAPDYDCTDAVVAEPSEDGTSYEWPVGELEMNGVLGVALLAVGPNDRVVFAAPDDGSLVTRPSAEVAAPVAPPVTEDAVAPPAGAGPSGGVPSVPRAPAAAPAAPAPAAAPAVAQPPAPVVPDVAPTFQPTSALAVEELDALVAVLTVLALAGGAFLWARAGRDERSPETAGAT